MSDSMVDKNISPRLAALAAQEKPDPYELQRIIDECVYGSLCADTIIVALNCIRETLMKELYR